MMKLGFTGTRIGMTAEQKATIADLILSIDPDVACHGCCRGADVDFHNLLLKYREHFNPELKIHGHPSESTYNPQDQCSDLCKGLDVIHPTGKPLSRNALMVKESNLILGCPPNFENVLRSGTWSTMRKAKRKGKVIIVFPDGTTEKHIEKVKL